MLAGALVLALGTGAILNAASVAGIAKPTVVEVVAGAPYEFAFQLSRYSAVPSGPITFVIKNHGTTGHDFVLCQAPVKTDERNSCIGYQSRDLQPGESTRITIGDVGRGKYEFLSADPGDAEAGMKGLLGVGVVVAAPVVKPPPKAQPPKTQPPVPAVTAPSVSPLPSPQPVTTTPTDTSTTGGYICKRNGLIQGVSTPQLCN